MLKRMLQQSLMVVDLVHSVSVGFVFASWHPRVLVGRNEDLVLEYHIRSVECCVRQDLGQLRVVEGHHECNIHGLGPLSHLSVRSQDQDSYTRYTMHV